MARYWAYINNEVMGPYGVEELIRLRGFSRQTMVCLDDASGAPRKWISPAEIPELAPIFKAVDEHQSKSPAAPPAKSATKPPVVPAAPKVPPMTSPVKRRGMPKAEKWGWGGLVLFIVLGTAAAWIASQNRVARFRDIRNVQALVESALLPDSSLFANLREYIQEKKIKPKWEIEKTTAGLYHVIVSWYFQPEASKAGSLTVYAFEVNLQAQNVRALNTAASQLMSVGFPRPPAPKPPAPKFSPTAVFMKTLDEVNDAVQNRDFLTLWRSFSRRKKAEMAKAGISQEGFIRLQNLTVRGDSGLKQVVLKTKGQSETEQLALLKQTQPQHADILVKQFWVFEEGQWKLDDEEKRPAASSTPVKAPSSNPVVSSTVTSPSPVLLPGMGR
jgi:hypothetical protein